jgi:hypothetical protein
MIKNLEGKTKAVSMTTFVYDNAVDISNKSFHGLIDLD